MAYLGGLNCLDGCFDDSGCLYGSPEWIASQPKPTEAERMQNFYNDVASGKIVITNFDVLFSDANLAVSKFEFSLLPANVQAAARANPQQFIQTVLANRNSANQDLLSVGAEGGYANYINATWVPNVGLKPDPNAYLSIHDQNALTKIRDAVETAAVVAGNYFLPGSAIITQNVASKGSQEQLGSTIGKIALMVSAIGGANNSFAGPELSDNAAEQVSYNAAQAATETAASAMEPVATAAAQGLVAQQLSYNATQAAAETSASAMEPAAMATPSISATKLISGATDAAKLVGAGVKLVTAAESLKLINEASKTGPSNFSALPDTGPTADLTSPPTISQKPLTNYLPYVLFGLGAVAILATRK